MEHPTNTPTFILDDAYQRIASSMAVPDRLINTPSGKSAVDLKVSQYFRPTDPSQQLMNALSPHKPRRRPYGWKRMSKLQRCTRWYWAGGWEFDFSEHFNKPLRPLEAIM